MFENFKFTSRQIEKYYRSALRDFKIAKESKVPEVTFRFCYDAFIKLAITLCAQKNLRVKSRQGHHVALIHKMAELLQDEEIEAIGNTMRSKRNWDLYSGGMSISEKENREYITWLKNIFLKAEKSLKKSEGRHKLF